MIDQFAQNIGVRVSEKGSKQKVERKKFLMMDDAHLVHICQHLVGMNINRGLIEKMNTLSMAYQQLDCLL